MINQRKDSKTYTSQQIEDETHLFLFHYHFIVNTEIKYTTQNLISIKVLFSMQYSVKHPKFEPNNDNPQETRMTMSFFCVKKNVSKLPTKRKLKQEMSYRRLWNVSSKI